MIRWLLPLFLLGVVRAALAQEGELSPLRERLARLQAEESRLRAVEDKIRAGDAVHPAEAVAKLDAVGQTESFPLELDLVLPNESELAFERARLEAVRDRLRRLERAAPAAPAPEPAPEPTPEATPVKVAPRYVAPPAKLAPKSESKPAPRPAPAPEPETEFVADPDLPADPMRLGDALLAQGDYEQALEAYGVASSQAEERGQLGQVARARYGAARALERMGQADDAIKAYAAVQELPEAGEWAKAAAFARKFIDWQRRVHTSALAALEEGE